MIRVLVVDDSALMRSAISDLIDSQPDMEVVATAKNGLEALKLVEKHDPDVVTLDINMPVMDGLKTLKKMMGENPKPVIMLSALTKEGAKETIEALKFGAVDFVPKPGGTISPDLSEVREEIIEKIRTVSSISPSFIRLQNLKKFKLGTVHGKWGNNRDLVVLIGSSTGGPSALEQIIPRLPSDFPCPVLIVQHMPPNFTEQLASRLDSMSELRVKEADNNDRLEEGTVYIAPGGFHMKIRRSLGVSRLKIVDGVPVNAVKPSIDVTADSLVSAYHGRVVGVILTGMGSDGAYGMKRIRDSGGKAIACSEDTCVVFGMPKSAIQMNAIDSIKPLYEIPEEIVKFVEVMTGGY
jgi:two-component system chemotaxis response regulator CheB